MNVTCSNQLNQLQPLLLHQPLPPGVQVFRGRLFGFDWKGGDSSDGRGRPELDGQRCRLWTSQVTHFTHNGRRVVQIGTELTHPLQRETERKESQTTLKFCVDCTPHSFDQIYSYRSHQTKTKSFKFTF